MRIWAPDVRPYSAAYDAVRIWTSCVESTSAAPRLVPLERVRVAGAPSNVIKFSGLREPLKFAGPWLKKALRLASVPPRAPGTSAAKPTGLRPFSSSESICSRLTSFCAEADSDCSTAAVAETSTVCVVTPTSSVASTVRAALGSSLLLVLSYLLKPDASTLILYEPGGTLVMV